ncbi:MAG TPA: sugar transferase, partial [Nitrosomonas europaea]|nr:sugar transferase [Nitrosomonas europaea]
NMRHSIKPGITGWAQVRYPYGASIEDAIEKLQYDLYYVKNHSLFLDFVILIDTVGVVLLRKGSR